MAIINAYNEEDIIGETVNHLLHQGVDVTVVDNWSSDRTYEIVHEIFCTESRVRVLRFPEQPVEQYQWERLLQNTETLGRDSGYDWLIHNDADELRYSPWRNVRLKEAIEFVDSLGYNAVDFTVLNFSFLNGLPSITGQYEHRLRFFDFGRHPAHFIQIKAWKNAPYKSVNLAQSGGHEVIFPDRRVYPIKFTVKHYPLRNPEQATRKVKERLLRPAEEREKKGWHVHYDSLAGQEIFERQSLMPWREVTFTSEYLVESISGIGVL
jgi:glycosyltransferase involved in cell wall biosynthesis